MLGDERELKEFIEVWCALRGTEHSAKRDFKKEERKRRKKNQNKIESGVE
jgi:hypothetical protein